MPKKSTKRRRVRKKAVTKKRPARKKVAAKRSAKAPKKSARKSAGGRPFKKGADPRRGRGPKKGAPNAGRPSNELVERCREMGLSTVLPKIFAYLKKKSGDPDTAGWRWAAELVIERGFGKAPQAIEIGPKLTDDERIDKLAQFIELGKERLEGKE